MADADQGEVIAFLERPETYGVREVERIETHASMVFLAGDLAYKLKRSVKYSYLDYSTPELRRQACEAEVALNRRTAPDLYLGTRPVTRDDDGRLRLGGRGQAVDWVVEMRRFDEDSLFDRMAGRGTLTRAQALDLADRIAEFHASLEPDMDFGGHAAMADVVAGNRRNLEAWAPRVFDRGAAADLDRLTMERLDSVGPLLDSRRAAGKVRLCHGDLHLRNICLVEGRPTLFDCIEFSRAIACIDVLYDLAFLLMDLHTRRLDELGNAVFNRYLDLCSEIDGIPALPLFLSVRAAVRAHVEATAAAKQEDADAEARLADEARRYLATAIALLRPAPPRLLAIGGFSATGKSTLAYGLAPALGAVPGARVLRSDVIRKRLFGAELATRLPEAAYSSDATHRVYATMRHNAAEVLAGGHSVIADAVFARPDERTDMAEVARTVGAPFVGFWLEAPLDVLERRLADRRGDASDATIAVLRRQRGYDLGRVDWLKVDATGNTDATLEATRRALAAAI